MIDFEFYLIMFSIILMALAMFCRQYIICIITPRVDKYNGRKSDGNYFSNSLQTDKYMIAFFCPEFYKKFKGYREELVFYKAKPRDKFFFKIYLYTLYISALALLLFFAAAKGWFR